MSPTNGSMQNSERAHRRVTSASAMTIIQSCPRCGERLPFGRLVDASEVWPFMATGKPKVIHQATHVQRVDQRLLQH